MHISTLLLQSLVDICAYNDDDDNADYVHRDVILSHT